MRDRFATIKIQSEIRIIVINAVLLLKIAFVREIKPSSTAKLLFNQFIFDSLTFSL